MYGSTSLGERLKFVELPRAGSATDLGQAVRKGLADSPKTLPSLFFYDHAGSELFERICTTPEYYLTRTEQAILESHAAEMVAVASPRPIELVEFGSGSSAKTRIMLQAALAAYQTVRYLPIDVSGAFLRESVEALLAQFPGLRVHALAGEYRDGLASLPDGDRESRSSRLFLFMGSNMGNLTDAEAVAFLACVRSVCGPDDRLLLGVDLAKDPEVVRSAYNDAEGVTAAFNLNVLARINRELGGEFDLSAFRHEAPYLEDQGRVEMRLVSERDQRVRIAGLGAEYAFSAGEPIRTEVSQKYTVGRIADILGQAGFGIVKLWQDRRGWFLVTLARPVSPIARETSPDA